MATFSQSVTNTIYDYRHLAAGIGSWSNSANPLYMGEAGGDPMHLVAGFTSVTIPPGSTVSNATITFRTTTNGFGSGTLNTKISAIDEDDAAPAANGTECVADASLLTTAKVDWDFTLDHSDNVALTTPNFSTVIQEIIDRAGWASGNKIMVWIGNDGSSNKYQTVASVENPSGYATAAISITYTAPVVGPANLKSFDGNVKANIKSMDGNLLANVKSFDGNS